MLFIDANYPFYVKSTLTYFKLSRFSFMPNFYKLIVVGRWGYTLKGQTAPGYGF
jgi:hypothetical protein